MTTSIPRKMMPEQLSLGEWPSDNRSPKLPTMSAAEALAGQLIRRVVRLLQQMHHPAMLSSGQDSGLKCVWDEICVQQQAFESVDWGLHERLLEGMITGMVTTLTPPKRQTLWLLTDKGWSWHYDVSKGFEPQEREAIPVDEELIQILTTRLLSFASDYGNARIRNYLDRPAW